MALGTKTVFGDGNIVRIEALASTTTTSAVPSSATDGISLLDIGLGDIPSEGIINIVSTAGSVTMTVGIRVWGYNEISAAVGWSPVPLGVIGTGTDATRGSLNSGVAIGEVTAADTIRYSEVISYLSLYSRIYLQVTSIGGTSTAVTGYLTVRRGW